MIRRAAAITSFLLALPCGAQKIANSAMVWFGAFGDSRFGARSSMYWDLQIRRANEGAIWQQLLGTIGYTHDLSPHWRATLATEFTHGYRYGPFPAKANAVVRRRFKPRGGALRRQIIQELAVEFPLRG